MFVAVERQRFAVADKIAVQGSAVAEKTLLGREVQFEQAASRIVDEN